MESIAFLAHRIKIFPPTEGENLTVSFQMGVDSLPVLQSAMPWQMNKGTGKLFKVTVERIDAEG